MVVVGIVGGYVVELVGATAGELPLEAMRSWWFGLNRRFSLKRYRSNTFSFISARYAPFTKCLRCLQLRNCAGWAGRGQYVLLPINLLRHQDALHSRAFSVFEVTRFLVTMLCLLDVCWYYKTLPHQSQLWLLLIIFNTSRLCRHRRSTLYRQLYRLWRL